MTHEHSAQEMAREAQSEELMERLRDVHRRNPAEYIEICGIIDGIRALASPPSSDALREETGWLIEHGSHKIPTYWSKDGWGRWSSDHRKAIRFSRRQDAFAVSLMLGDKPNDPPHRIVEHAWSDKGSPALAERDQNIRVMGFCEKCNRYLPLIGKLCQKCTEATLATNPSSDAPKVNWDEAGHTADAIRDALLAVGMGVISFDKSRDVAALVMAHVAKFRPPSDALREALTKALAWIDGTVCRHEETHRGGIIWTICDQCGRSFADDRGGVPLPAFPKIMDEIEAVLGISAQPSTGRE